MGAKPILTHPVSPPPDRIDELPTPTEQWYLECLRQWCQAMGRAPTIRELAAWIQRTVMPTFTALKRLQAKGLVARTARQRFIPTEFAGVLRD